MRHTYMRSNKICYEIKAKTPPNGAKDVTCHFLHSFHHVYTVIDLREELEQEHQQENRHYKLYLLAFDQSWNYQPKNSLQIRKRLKTLLVPQLT